MNRLGAAIVFDERCLRTPKGRDGENLSAVGVFSTAEKMGPRNLRHSWKDGIDLKCALFCFSRRHA